MATHVDAVHELLEREHELETVAAAVARAAEGAGALVLIEGPAGVGKSRLLASARALARERGMQVLEARGAVLEREFAFGLARQLFEDAVAPRPGADNDALFAGAAGRAASLLGEGGRGVHAEPGDASFGALHGLYWLSVNLADRGPLLLSVDDAHWADRSSLGFLSYLSRRLEGLPLLLMVAGRSPDPEGDELWRQLAEDPLATLIQPRPLSERAVGELVHHRLGARADEEFCRACQRATGGNPLFLRELVAALEQADIPPTGESAAVVTEVGPSAVARFVLHRLKRLGAPATALARAVAVLGGDAELAIAAPAAELDQAEARHAADLLVQAEIFAQHQRLAFVHPIVQAAIYEDLLPGERAMRHLAAARLLEAAGAPAERIAAHLVKAGPVGDAKWVAVLRAAALDASQRGDPSAAAGYLRRALDESPTGGVKAELLCDLGRWETAIHNYEAAEQRLLAALEQPDAERALRARAAVWLGRNATVWGEPGPAAVALDAILAEQDGAPRELALELEAETLSLTRIELSLRHLFPERLAAFERLAADDRRFEPIGRIHAASERMVQGDPVNEIADAIEAALAAGPPGDPYALGMAIETLTGAERYDVAAGWLEMALGVARTWGYGPQLAGLHSERALLGLARGAVGEAELDARTALEFADERHFLLPRIVGVAIRVALERGELDAAKALAEAHPNLDRERVTADEFLTGRGMLRVRSGEVREGVADLLRCGEYLAAHHVPRPAEWRPEAARALAELGEADRAEQLAREAIPPARRFGAAGPLGKALRCAGRVIGGEEGLVMLEEAARVVEHSPARLEAAYALADLGGELVKQRRRREAREALRLALEGALKCGAGALADRVRGDLGAGGGRPPRLELSGVDALTPAERRVCDLAAQELTNREVAQQLFVTEKTVELHLTNAYRKLGIRSRFQLSGVIPAAAAPE